MSQLAAVEREKGEQTGGVRIRCPLCEWTPRPDDLWSCSCGHMWHTFDTGGVCPACLTEWKMTQCLSCHGWSAHSDWYVYE
jgi:hypothetical protein